RGGLDGALEQATGRARFLFGLGSVEREGRLATLDHAVNRVDRFLTGDLAGGMSSHPVGNDPQTEFVIAEVGVFVHGATTSDVRTPVGTHDVRRGHDWHSSSGYQCFSLA